MSTPSTATARPRRAKAATARVVTVTPTVKAPKVSKGVAVKATPAKVAPKATKPPTMETPAAQLKRLQQAASRDQYELHLLRDIMACKLPEPTRQFLWHPTIAYRADLCFVRERLMVEVDGGVYLRHGHHNSGKGYEYDRVRDAEAICLGYTVLRVTPGMVKDGTAVRYVERVLHAIWARGEVKRTA